MIDLKQVKIVEAKIKTANEKIEYNNSGIDEARKKIKVLWDKVKDMTLCAKETDKITDKIHVINSEVKTFKTSTKRALTSIGKHNDKLDYLNAQY